MRKILYSPGFGAGWSTWADDKIKKLMCEWKPLIEAIENKEDLSKNHPAIQSLLNEVKEKYGVDYICLGGLKNLEVFTCPDDCLVRINEHDGSESVESVEVGYQDYF